MRNLGFQSLELAVERLCATEKDWQRFFEACDIEGEDAKLYFVEKCRKFGKDVYAKRVLFEMVSERLITPAYVCIDYSEIKNLSFKRLVLSEGWPIRVNRLSEVDACDRGDFRNVYFSKGNASLIVNFDDLAKMTYRGRFNQGDRLLNDYDARCVSDVSDLRSVNIYQSDVSDSGALRLLSLPNLRRLHLAYSMVGNETVEALCDKELSDVSLRGTFITDAGAKYLAKNLKGVSSIDLLDCRKITKRGIKALCESGNEAVRSEGERLRVIYDRRI